MEKEALLNIILNDLQEVEMLVTSFQGNKKIADAFINLAERKLSHISEELSLLKTLENTEEEHAEIKPATKETVHTFKAEQIIKPVIRQETRPNIQPEINEPIPTQEPIAHQIAEKEETITPDLITKEQNTITDNSSLTEKEVIKQAILPVEEKIISKVSDAVPVQVPPPVIDKKIEQSTESVKEDRNKTLGETFMVDKKSVNDIIASNKSDSNRSFIGKPIHDLTKGLGINDRFLYQRELFSGNADMMKHTLQQLNEMQDLHSAVTFILSNFNWDQEAETTQSFMNYIKRKY